MQALYIRRLHRGRKVKHPLYDFYRDYCRLYKPGGHRWRFKGQNGFFRAALATQYSVKNVRIQNASKNIQSFSKDNDLIVCDSKAFLDNSHQQVVPIDFFRQADNIVKALLIANARPDVIPADEILDNFDIIFKREPFIDRDRYNISEANKKKIRATMLGCPLIDVKPKNVNKINPAELGYRKPSKSFDHDLFFSGINTAKVREDFVQRLSHEPFDFYGGLQFRKRAPEISEEYAFPRLKTKEYIDVMRRSRIGLVLEGEGPFTYRHLELWHLCSFMISTPHIRGLELPLSLEENEHYVCYESYDDLRDKISYYLNDTEERNAIALKGREMFERDFSYKKHGQFIKKCVSPQ